MNLEQNISCYKNLKLLYCLRWFAIIGQSLTIFFVSKILNIELPLFKMFQVIGAQIIINIITYELLRKKQNIIYISDKLLFFQLLLDVIILTLLIYFSGGFSNPFISLFLIQVIIAAIILPPASTWTMVVITTISYIFLAKFYIVVPNLVHAHGGDFFSLHLQGMLISYILSSILIAYFAVGMAQNLRERDHALGKAREDKLLEENFLKIGMISANAAHELGTPLSIVAIITNEIMKDRTQDLKLQKDMIKIDSQIKRCKQVIDEVLFISGDVRGQSTTQDVLSNYMHNMASGWLLNGFSGNFNINISDEISAINIAADKIFLTSITNFLNNSRDAGAENIIFNVSLKSSNLIIIIKDDGVGIPLNIISKLGKEPVESTSGGKGVGLVISSMVINRLGGKVSFERGSLKGTIVSIMIPLVALKIG